VIAERIGWQRGMTILKGRVRELRPSFRTARSITGSCRASRPL